MHCAHCEDRLKVEYPTLSGLQQMVNELVFKQLEREGYGPAAPIDTNLELNTVPFRFAER